jgi:hypothetical protein
MPRADQASPTGGEPAVEAGEPVFGGSRRNNLSTSRRITSTRAMRVQNQDAPPRPRQAPSVAPRKVVRYKMVVIGDGGVGKTALTIQVNNFCAPLRMELT